MIFLTLAALVINKQHNNIRQASDPSAGLWPICTCSLFFVLLLLHRIFIQQQHAEPLFFNKKGAVSRKMIWNTCSSLNSSLSSPAFLRRPPCSTQSCVVAKVWWVLCVHLTLLLHNTHLWAAASAWCVCLRAARVGGVHVRLCGCFSTAEGRLGALSASREVAAVEGSLFKSG